MNTTALDLTGRELSFVEFEHIAANIPKRSGQSVFSLIEIDIPDDPADMLSMYPEFRISRCCKGIFTSLSNAEEAMQGCVRENEPNIYCFKIFELPLDRLSDLGSPDYPNSIRTRLYGQKGEMLDSTLCSSLTEDLGTEYGHYLGKPKSQLRFKKGDIVEVIEADTVHLAIVSRDPIDTKWCYDFYCRTMNDSKCRCYILDYSDDQVAVVNGSKCGNHTHIQLCDMMVPRFPIGKELRREYEDCLVSSQTPCKSI